MTDKPGDAFAAGRQAGEATIARFLEMPATEPPPEWEHDRIFIFMMGLRAQRDGWGSMRDSRRYLDGAITAARAAQIGP